MRPGWLMFGPGLILVTLLVAGCNSKQPKQSAQSVSPSAPQDKTLPAADAAPKDKSISYAKNPERFVKEEVYDPPFNITNPKTAQEHFNVAVNDDHHDQTDKAIEEYKKALELQPKWAVAHFRMANDYKKKGQTEDAIAQWELATKDDPQFYSAYDLIAGAYERQGNLKKAIEAYSALLKYPPTQMPAHYQLGLWYAQLGERQKAEEHLKSYLDIARKVPEESKSDRFQKASQALEKIQQTG